MILDNLVNIKLWAQDTKLMSIVIEKYLMFSGSANLELYFFIREYMELQHFYLFRSIPHFKISKF